MFEKIYSFFSSKPLAVVFLIMLAFFLASVQTFLYGPVYPDEALYAWNAQKIFREPSSLFSEQLSDPYYPLIPLIASPLIAFLEPVQAVRVVSFIFSFIAIFLFYIVSKKFVDTKTSLIATALFAFTPVMLNFGPRAFLDVPAFCFLLLFALTFWQFMQTNSKKFLGYAFLSVVVMFFVKTYFLFFLAPFILYYILFKLNRKQQKIVFFIIIFIAILATFFYFFSDATNFFGEGYSFLPSSVLLNIEKIMLRESLDLTIFSALNITQMIAFNGLALFPIPFFFIGVLMLSKKNSKISRFLLTWFFVILLSLIFFNVIVGDERHLLSFMMPLLVFSASGITAFGEKLTSKSTVKKEFVVSLIVLFLIFGMLLVLPWANVGRVKASWVFYEIGGEIKQNTLPSESIFFSFEQGYKSRWLRLYSDREYSQYGGTLYPLPDSKEEFQEKLLGFSGRVFVVVDDSYYFFEKPFSGDWLYYSKEQKNQDLADLNFAMLKRIEFKVGSKKASFELWIREQT